LRKLAILTLAAVLSAPAVQVAHAQPAAEGPPTCTPSGYAPPSYGRFGGNSDGFLTAYEIASPCTPRRIRDAAQAIGMGRNVPLGIKNVTTTYFAAEGTYQGQPVSMRTHIDYVIPGIRMAIQGQPVQVYARGAVWNEASPGVDPSPAPASTIPEREALIKLTPYGAMWSVIEAEGHAQVTENADGTAVITGTSPYDGIAVTLTLTPEDFVDTVQFSHGGHDYAARFYDYGDHWDTGMPATYFVFFPGRMVWTRDGQPFADLNTTDSKGNSYVVFPMPDVAQR